MLHTVYTIYIHSMLWVRPILSRKAMQKAELPDLTLTLNIPLIIPKFVP